MLNYQHVYNRLIEVACAGTIISIDEIADYYCPEMQFPHNRNQINQALKAITYTEYSAGRPLLPAVVVLPEIGYPPMGFFLLARELGIILYHDERSFFEYELKRIHTYWAAQNPPQNYLSARKIYTGVSIG